MTVFCGKKIIQRYIYFSWNSIKHMLERKKHTTCFDLMFLVLLNLKGVLEQFLTKNMEKGRKVV